MSDEYERQVIAPGVSAMIRKERAGMKPKGAAPGKGTTKLSPPEAEADARRSLQEWSDAVNATYGALIEAIDAIPDDAKRHLIVKNMPDLYWYRRLFDSRLGDLSAHPAVGQSWNERYELIDVTAWNDHDLALLAELVHRERD